MVIVDRLWMQDRAVIGHFNLVNIDRILMRSDSRIGRMNILNGPFDLVLRTQAAIGNTNKIVRGPLGLVTVGRSVLRLGVLTKITSNHHIDCTKSVRFGDFSILAGVGSQLWTHGYIHDADGPGRYRVDGAIRVGDNVYIGAGCIINMGVNIVTAAIVGAGTTVARNLDQPGLWVSAAMRHLPRPAAPLQRTELVMVNDPRLCEPVYLKRGS
ncbi:MAG: hypothetical protein ABI645_00715 [Pseudomonadota bacterium]